MAELNAVVASVTERIIARSQATRRAYLDLMAARKPTSSVRTGLSDGNLAHAAAGCPVHDKTAMLGADWPNIGIVTAYNDMLSAHQPLGAYPDIIKAAARDVGATAQVAGGVPAMCDGVTQGKQGMELSLFSRDVIAMATAVSLSHDAFDAALYLGVCDKIVPGLMIGALRFGWLPSIFVPAGPMPSGLPNPEKAKIRQQFAAGEIGRDALLKAESESYHAPGTCTFYGTANSNQMLMEMMGLHMPGTAFVPPGASLRKALTGAAAQRAAALTLPKGGYSPLCDVVDEKAIVNGVVGLMATGGSTNLALHIPAIARAAGIIIDWEDFSDLSSATPLMCRIYPNGSADVNHFHAAGGMAFLVRELIAAGLVHEDVNTIAGDGGLARYAEEPFLDNGELVWRAGAEASGDTDILRPADVPFSPDGGMKVLNGNLGRGVIKTSAVAPERHVIEAPARVFDGQAEVKAAFEAGDLDMDCVIIVRFQGPQANGMPELHGLSPILGVLQDRGYKVALATDGRMSGASGKFPAAIHIGPEAACGGPLSKVQDGDVVRLDAQAGALDLTGVDLDARPAAMADLSGNERGLGRELFSSFRTGAATPEMGGGLFAELDPASASTPAGADA